MDDSASAPTTASVDDMMDALDSGGFNKTVNSSRKKRMSTYTTDDFTLFQGHLQ